MAIDPDVVARLKLIEDRLDVLEAQQPTASTPPLTVPYGPRAVSFVDPVAVGIATFDGTTYTVTADWDEAATGTALRFGAGPVDWNGHDLVGVEVVVTAPAGNGSVVYGGGSGSAIRIIDHASTPVGSAVGKGVFNFTNIEILDVVGDAWRPLRGSSIQDARIRIGTISGSAKHFDGMQFHNARNAPAGHDRSEQTIRRVVFEPVPKDPATGQPIGAVNSFIYFQSDNLDGSIIEDVTILDASGVWFPVRLTGTGTPLSVKNIVLQGTQGPPRGKPGKLAPSAAVLASPTAAAAIDPAELTTIPGVIPLKVR